MTIRCESTTLLTLAVMSIATLTITTNGAIAAPITIGDANLGGIVTDSGGPRLNIELTSLSLTAGTYDVLQAQADTVDTGNLIPVLYQRNGANNGYTLLWSGDSQAVTGTGNKTFNFTPGTEQFTLVSDADVFAGMHHDGGAKVRFLDHIGNVDHDGTPPGTFTVGDGLLDSDISNSNLDRTYMLQLTVDRAAVPEPASIAIWSLLGIALVSFGYYRMRCKN